VPAIPTVEQSSCPWRFWAARASDPGVGEGWGAGAPGWRGLLEVFLLAVRLGCWPRRGVARPCRLRVPIRSCFRGEEPLILGLTGAVIPVGLAVLSGLDSCPVVWRIGHGGGDVLALAEGGFRVEGFCAAFGIGFPMTRHPGTGAARERRVSGRELVETRAAKEKIPPSGCRPATAGSRRRTC